MHGDAWYYAAGGRRHGPITAGELRRMAASGAVGPADLVWAEGMADWMPARSVDWLFARPVSPKPAPTPRPLNRVPAPVASVGRVRQRWAEGVGRTGPVRAVARKWQTLSVPARVGAAGGLALLLLATCGGLVAVGPRPVGGRDAVLPFVDDVPTVSAWEIASEHKKDREAAQKKYNGKRFVVTGTVQCYRMQGRFVPVELVFGTGVPAGGGEFYEVRAEWGLERGAELRAELVRRKFDQRAEIDAPLRIAGTVKLGDYYNELFLVGCSIVGDGE